MDKYATHVPVLRALGEILEVRNVIEFDHVLVFDKLVPNTAILWNGSARNNIAEYIIKKAGEETK